MSATPTTPPPALRPYLTARHDMLWQEADAFATEHVRLLHTARMRPGPASRTRSDRTGERDPAVTGR